ncbi:hypothetical protein GCM10020218_086330 [Dactylosporangium vinaceum]
MLIRPKSIATVVVVLSGTAAVSSTPTLAPVSTASVVNGVISETAATNVVLPAPNPPAMTIFADVTRRVPVTVLVMCCAGLVMLAAAPAAAV